MGEVQGRIICRLPSSCYANNAKIRQLSPICLLTDMLNFALELHTSKIAPGVVDALVAVAASTIELVARPRFRQLPEEYQVDTTACMRLLYLVAQGCMSRPEDIARFWKKMRWEFVLVMVNTNQREEDSLTMIKMLSSSMAKESWGPIPDGEMLANDSGVIMDHLLKGMVEVPCTSDTEKISQDRFYRLRLQRLQLFTSMTRSPIASQTLAAHPKAIALFVDLVSEEISNLYDHKSGSEERYAHKNAFTHSANHIQCSIDQPSNAAALPSYNETRKHRHAKKACGYPWWPSEIPALPVATKLH